MFHWYIVAVGTGPPYPLLERKGTGKFGIYSCVRNNLPNCTQWGWRQGQNYVPLQESA